MESNNKKRHLKFFGDVIRMDEDIPVKKALKYATEPFKKLIGKPKTTWLYPHIKAKR